MDFNKCMICPRRCGADRINGKGICGAGSSIRIARIGLHEWEEPCISYGKGSGTVFFSGCSLKCVFCQNNEISAGFKGVDITVEKLADEFLRLQENGAVNINLVTPTHFACDIINALDSVKHKLKIPVCYNCGGYESTEIIANLKGYIDVFMPDFKYYSSEYSLRYSRAANYFEIASNALKMMHDIAGYPIFDDEGHMKKGVLVRHLVLPYLYKDSINILEYLASEYDTSKMGLSIMSQYFPTENCKNYPEINRRITTLEYMKVVNKALELGFVNAYIQDKNSADSSYVPDFDYHKST